mgnify:CR=1 FL=1
MVLVISSMAVAEQQPKNDIDVFNFIAMISYLEEKGYDCSPIWERSSMSRDFLMTKGNRTNLERGLEVMRAVHDITQNPDPRLFYTIGVESSRLKSYGTLIDIANKFGNVENIVRFIPRFNRKFNDIFDMAVHNVNRGSAIVTIDYRDIPEYEGKWMFSQDPWNEGIIAGAPLAISAELSPMDTDPVLSRFTIEELFRAYSFTGKTLEKKGYSYFVDGREVAREFLLNDEEVESSGDLLQPLRRASRQRIVTNRDPLDIEKATNLDVQDMHKGVVFMRDFSISDAWTIKEGYVFGAPYSRVNLRWKVRRSLRQTLGEFIIGDRDSTLNIIQGYEEEASKNRRQRIEIERLYENLQKQREAERRRERIMTGGFAHEVRNALSGTKYRLSSVLDYYEGRSTVQATRENLADLAKTVLTFNEEYGVPMEVIEKQVISRLHMVNDALSRTQSTLEHTYNNNERGLEITNLIRAYSKLQEEVPGEEEVHLDALVNGICENYRNTMEERGISHTFTSDVHRPYVADGGHMDSIVRNLLLNAIDAVEETREPRIDVTLSEIVRDDGDYLRITVADNGCGIPRGELDHVFDPFYSTKPTTGTGLGLSVARRMADLYGEMHLDSTEGVGTTFYVDLRRDDG